MTKIIIVIIIVAALAVGIYLWVRNNQSSLDNASPKGETPQGTTQGEQVTIENFAFSPSTLTIKAGTKVKWVNQDSVAHTVKSDTFASDTLQTGESYTFQFDQTGTYDYFCSLHPAMKGKIIVE